MGVGCEDITWFGLLVHTMSTNTRYQTLLPLLSWSVVTKCLATEAKVRQGKQVNFITSANGFNTKWTSGWYSSACCLPLAQVSSLLSTNSQCTHVYGCLCQYMHALRIVSTDKILHFINLCFNYYLLAKVAFYFYTPCITFHSCFALCYMSSALLLLAWLRNQTG